MFELLFWWAEASGLSSTLALVGLVSCPVISQFQNRHLINPQSLNRLRKYKALSCLSFVCKLSNPSVKSSTLQVQFTGVVV